MPEELEAQQEQSIEDVRPDDTVTGHVAKHDFMLSNTVQIGRVVAPEKGDPPKPKTGAFVLVHIGGEEPKSYTRNWMPWLSRRAGLDAEWWKPDLDEQVLVLAPSGNLAIGVVAGSIYRGTRMYFPPSVDLTKAAGSDSVERLPAECSAHAEADLTNHTAQSAEHIHKQVYRDGTTMQYDSILHNLAYQLKRSHAEESPSVSLNSTLGESSGTVVLTLGEPDGSKPILSLCAKLEKKNGSLTLMLGQNASLSAALTDDKGSIAIAVGSTKIKLTDELITVTDPDGSIIEMQKKAMKFIDASNNALEMNDSGIKLSSAKKIVLDGGGTTVTVDSNGAAVD